VPKLNAAQIGVFNRIAPPGTFLNVAPIRMSQLNPITISDDEEDQVVHQLDDQISDSEDELSREDPSNIPPAPLSRIKLEPVEVNDAETTVASDAAARSPISLGKSAELEAKARLQEHDPASKPKTPARFLEQEAMIRRIQGVLPYESRAAIIEQLKKHGNEDDIVAALLDKSHAVDSAVAPDDELAPSPEKGIAKPRIQKAGNLSKKGVDGHKSLAQKLNLLDDDRKRSSSPVTEPSTEQPSRDPSVEPATKRRRLRQGLRPTPKTELIEISSDESTNEAEKEIIEISSDEESERDATPEPEDNSLLNYINVCDANQLADLGNVSPEDAGIIIDQRPFASLDEIREVRNPGDPQLGRKVSRKRPIGDKIVDACVDMWNGLAAVDRLVHKCKTLGALVKEGMTELNLTSNGLEVVATGDSRVDSGVGTPTSSPPGARLEKPSNMADDLTLKDYQVVGLNWLNLIYSKGLSGILADDMGLGKTCQVVSFISHLVDTGVEGVHLIVVPGSTMENWTREFQRFSPQLQVYPYHGLQGERKRMQKVIQRTLRHIDVVVTTYDMAQNKDDNKFLRSLEPCTAIYDEGHMLKNKTSQRYKMLMKINTPWRLLLTGTPLQNNLQELISILGFIMPTLFYQIEGDLDFIFKQQAKDSVLQGSTAKLLSSQRVERAREMMAPFILRRKKEQVVKHLPPKICKVVYCDMTPRQKSAHDEYTALHLAALQRNDATAHQENHLMNSRKAAIHPLLFRYLYSDDDIEEMHKLVPKTGKFRARSNIAIKDELLWWSDYKIHKLCRETSALAKFRLSNDEWMDSGKVTKLLEVLAANDKEGSRTLLFSQFTGVMDILEWVFEKEDIAFCRLDGDTPIADRQALIDRFAGDETIKVFMLSTRAGGVGINLACANKVVIFDASFNPHDDIQAENRSHRIGQTRDVEVVRLVTAGTIEERIYALGQSKLALDRLVSSKRAEEMALEMVGAMMREGAAAGAAAE
jgi:SWI/SNF-related matrix-associated actin-dependent regulator 1 of chromatin subfamily A